ncbi:BNIP - RELATED [Salix koriyanagi]|uniref:BNIP - RELATED n=1 Tax=Salix koriyanagi TaxID=2511006 RepID=A0A9Q0PI57_9ROSI|nr:BNIP - RELATED [Salix koriyanagi]
MMTMDRRFSRDSSRESKGSIALQKKIVESQRPHTAKNVPDLTDFMNDMFFGTMDDDKKACNLTGCHSEDEEESFDDSTRSSSSELPQEWLDAARRMVACVNSFEV